MKNSLFLFAATFCAVFSLFAQAPAIEWQNTIGGDTADIFTCLQQTSDGGYILGGRSHSNTSGDKTENSLGDTDFWVVKLNAGGAIQWQNTIGGDHFDGLYSLQQTSDGGYILAGSSDSNISGDKTENSLGLHDGWVVKLDATGNIQWQNSIGGEDNDFIYSLQQTTDGGYILGGSSRSDISGDKTENSMGDEDYWVIKLDAGGNIQWQNTIGGNKKDVSIQVRQTTDGGYILGGHSYSDHSGDKAENSLGTRDYWVVKLDAAGNIQWQNTIGGDQGDDLLAVQQTSDGGYIVAGVSDSDLSGDKTVECEGGHDDGWVLKLDATGNIQWQISVGGHLYDTIDDLQQTTDGGYILGGYSASNISCEKTEDRLGVFDYWVIKIDANGSIQWQHTIGGNNSDQIVAIQQTSDGGYILGGQSASDISSDKNENGIGHYDYWIIKLSPELVPTTAPTTKKALTIYPNPAADAVLVRTEAPTHLSLYNAFGQMMLTQTVQNGDKMDLSTLPIGLYFLVETASGQAQKLLKNK